MASQRVFISPGIFTTETDLTFVTRQIGVTTLGLMGETVKGPAFQPIFVSNYDEFKRFYGGLDATKVEDNGAPLYELPYIAKSYLSQSNQLFVNRVLGFSGYDAGESWAITVDAALDSSTVVSGSVTPSPTLISYTATTGGSLTTVTSTDARIQELIDQNLISDSLAFLGTAATGTTGSIVQTFYKTSGSTFEGVSVDLLVTNTTTTTGGTTGVVSGITSYFDGTSFSDSEDRVVALLRSRGKYDGNEILNFDVTALGIDSTNVNAEANVLGDFSLSGNSLVHGNFVYNVSFDTTKKNYITRVLGRNEKDGNTALFVEENYRNMLSNLIADGKLRGVNLSLVEYNNSFNDYKSQYTEATTPFIVSEVRGNKVIKLFRLITISDGNSANKEIKISITNIKPDDKEFDVIIRAYNDTDANPSILERFSRCTMDPNSNNYIARRIGTIDGEYVSKSNYILVELDKTSDTSDAFPAGFLGYPKRDYSNDGNVAANDPEISYKEEYAFGENKRKVYLGLSDITGIDDDFFSYKGKPDSSIVNTFTGRTNGFHLDIDASGVTIDNTNIVINASDDTVAMPVNFDTGNAEFKTDSGLSGTDYEDIRGRKFTFVPYGGFDGWDVYRDRRTNLDSFRFNGGKGQAGLTQGNFSNKSTSTREPGLTSDYYAYFEAMRQFANPESININVFATPGLDTFDNTNLIEDTIEMIETERCDSLYIVTTPDTDSAGDVLTEDDVVNQLDGQFDSNYTATYWPWVQINDAENNKLIYVPPTRDVVRNIALTDNISFPWFSIAGVRRGDVSAERARKKLTNDQRDVLYDGRVNPIATFASEGIKIWGNKTLQVADTALNRINVRRLLLQTRKLVSAVSIRLLFEQNDDVVRNEFLSLVNPILDNIRAERGITDFRVELIDDPDARDRGELCGRVFLKPTRALEFICVDFVLTPTGANFDDI